MVIFTRYAEKKFDTLNKCNIYFTREQIEDVINYPEKINKKGGNYFAKKDNIRVVYKKEGMAVKIITFYPL